MNQPHPGHGVDESPPRDRKLLAREPGVITASITTAVIAIAALLREFGVPLTAGQSTAIVGVIGAVGALAAAIIARRYSTPLSDPRDNQGRRLVPEQPLGGAW